MTHTHTHIQQRVVIDSGGSHFKEILTDDTKPLSGGLSPAKEANVAIVIEKSESL